MPRSIARTSNPLLATERGIDDVVFFERSPDVPHVNFIILYQ